MEYFKYLHGDFCFSCNLPLLVYMFCVVTFLGVHGCVCMYDGDIVKPTVYVKSELSLLPAGKCTKEMLVYFFIIMIMIITGTISRWTKTFVCMHADACAHMHVCCENS